MKQWIGNLKLRYKILLCMVLITTFSLLTICFFSYHFLYKRNQQDALNKAENSIHMISSTLSTQFDNIGLNTANTLVSYPFSEIITNITFGKPSSFITYFSASDKALSALRRSDDLISTAMIYGSNGTFFDETILGLSKNPAILFAEDIWNYSQITVLPMRSNALIQRGNILPIIFPVSSTGYGDNTMIRYIDIPNTPKTRFILLLNADQLQNYFDRFSNIFTHCMYLTDQNGYPLTINPIDHPELFSSDIIEYSASHNTIPNHLINIEGVPYYITQQTLDFCNLKLVHLIQQTSLAKELKPIRFFILETWGFSIFLAVLLSLAISNFLTRPFSKLNLIIQKINQNVYKEKTHFSYTDEVGILGEQLNSMYDIIQLQMEQIKEEEQKKARAEIQMLSEQINPHFLYNTLECIHFQILNQHTQVAGAMLESLGKYLRITLSSGDSMIPFQKEIDHVTAYMQIMNRHSTSGIRFSCQIDPILEQHMILKMLLQPLAENSIKHGFSQNLINSPLAPPEISIQISLIEEQKIRIEVTDNGSGIDIEKAKSCLLSASSNGKRHFGLNNVYKRLKATYGSDCSMDFSSIPYFRNSVIIGIPYLVPSEKAPT